MSGGHGLAHTKGQFKLSTTMEMLFLGTETLDPRITFTRADATSCATRFNAQGKLEVLAANVPRFDYDPATPGGVTGGELKSNGNLAISGVPPAGSSYDKASGVGALRRTDVGNRTDTVFTGLAVGNCYAINISCDAGNVGDLSLRINGGSSPQALVSPGTSSVYYIWIGADGTLTFVVNGNGGVIGFTLASLQQVTFAPKGLLIEESRTNIILNNRDTTQADWSVKTDITTARNQISLDGTANSANLVTEGSAGTATLSAPPSTAVTAGATITFSVVMKRGNTDWIRLKVGESVLVDCNNSYFNLGTGVKGSNVVGGVATNLANTMTSLGGGWYRLTVTCTPNGTFTLANFTIQSATADGNSTRVNGATYTIDYAQMEVGAFATSPIPTAAAAVTRATDNAVMTGVNFTSWYNAAQGTFIAEADVIAYTSANTFFNVSNGTFNERLQVRGSSAPNINSIYTVGGVVLSSPSGVSINAVNVPTKVGFSYTSGAQSIVSKGGPVNTAAAVGTPAGNQFGIGIVFAGASSEMLNGHVRSIAYYNTKLPDANLQQLTL